MNWPLISFWSSAALSAVFAAAGAAYLLAPWLLGKIQNRWSRAHASGRVIGILDLLAAIFLIVPQTRIWGVFLGASILFWAAVMLLGHRRYVLAAPAIAMLAALPLALAAGPF